MSYADFMTAILSLFTRKETKQQGRLLRGTAVVSEMNLPSELWSWLQNFHMLTMIMKYSHSRTFKDLWHQIPITFKDLPHSPGLSRSWKN